MAFLRRKRRESPTKGLSEKPVIGSPQAQVAQSTPPPLYSRFATSSASSSQLRLVSGPMTLQQRPSFSDRPRNDDPRRRSNAPSNPNLRAAQPPQNPTRMRSPKVDKPLPPPGPSSPDLELPPPVVNGHSAVPQPRPHANPPPPQSTSSPPPPGSFLPPNVTASNTAKRKSTTSLISDLPEHMYNIHSLDFDNLSDLNTNTPPPKPQQTLARIASEVASPRKVVQSSQQRPPQLPAVKMESHQVQVSSSLPLPDALSPTQPTPDQNGLASKRLSRPLPSPGTSTPPMRTATQSTTSRQAPQGPIQPSQGRITRKVSSVPQPEARRPLPNIRSNGQPTTNYSAQNSAPLNNQQVPRQSPQPINQGSTQGSILHRSTSRAVPHAALMQSSSSSSLSRAASQHQSSTTPVPPSSTSKDPTTLPKVNKRMTFTSTDSPYSLANPVSSAVLKPKSDAEPGKRLIDLDDPTPIAPINVDPSNIGRRPSTTDGLRATMRKGPLIFAASGGEEEVDSGKYSNGGKGSYPSRPHTADSENQIHVARRPSGAQAPQSRLHLSSTGHQQQQQRHVLHHPQQPQQPQQPPQEPQQHHVLHHPQHPPQEHQQPHVLHHPQHPPQGQPPNPVHPRKVHQPIVARKPSKVNPLYPMPIQSISEPPTPPQPHPSASPPPQLHAYGSKSTILSNMGSSSSRSDTPARPETGDSLASSSSLSLSPQSIQRRQDSISENRMRQDSASRKRDPLLPSQEGGGDEMNKKPHRLVKQKSGSARPGTAERLNVLSSHSSSSLIGDFGMGGGNGWDGQGEVSKVDDETIRKAGLPLDDDPFASTGITVIQATPPMTVSSESNGGRPTTPKDKRGVGAAAFGFSPGGTTVPASPRSLPSPPPAAPSSSMSPSRQYRARADVMAPQPLPKLADLPVALDRDAAPFPLPQFLTFSPTVLKSLLVWLNFHDFCCLSVVTRDVRNVFEERDDLREVILERFLGVVGYEKWAWGKESENADAAVAVNGSGRKGMKERREGDNKEPLKLTLQDLIDYMRGISMPVHEYGRTAAQHIHQVRHIAREQRDPEVGYRIAKFASSARSYTRVVLRLRAQAERSQKDRDQEKVEEQRQRRRESSQRSPQGTIPPNSYHNGRQPSRPQSRSSSRAPSPTMSMFSHSHPGGHQGFSPSRTPPMPMSQSMVSISQPKVSAVSNSPLFRLRRAPLLQVFVPSPDGTWLSDASVLECEAELRRAGVVGLLRPGDVIWDVAVGDEANVGRLIWDGSYLIDLDYTYSNVGDLPKYMPGLAFPPSYFHKVIRTPSSASNPIIHIDISPWGEEIASHLQLLQDRVRTETPQGGHHNVVRWVHRSSFVIQPPAIPKQPSFSSYYYNDPRRTQKAVETPKISIPGHQGMFVDSGWYGTIVVETEGTNEALADLQARCGPGAFPSRPNRVGHDNPGVAGREIEQRKVFRILRERSRPGEISIRAVTVKERIL